MTQELIEIKLNDPIILRSKINPDFLKKGIVRKITDTRITVKLTDGKRKIFVVFDRITGMFPSNVSLCRDAYISKGDL